ncbi:class I SAM-dependent methyltransferase [Aurantimonas sp. HBX-1]|uniref:class I SAM-dependent methyltransferase n=1 Tax=Aurantimonas sp. HBX-1 TaxID=2906072 RepID=UPI001F26E261|nr:phospholipid methyltransferase [Aurantimonas sp. HBX-1]UIJ71708.1 phospholipid methyltransferase [Aurantimonas sp. HBX-1]
MLVTPEPRLPQRTRPRRKVSDEARFFRGWLQRPLVMGAVSPSSRALGRVMAAYVPDPTGFDDTSLVLELGPGTGVVTKCLIERGVPESALVLVEYSQEFCVLLRSRFPAARVIQGDAYAVHETLRELLKGRRLEAVISGLPLFTKPDAMREDVVGGALRQMPAGAPFIQFSYALTVPVKPERIGARLETSPWIKRNLPPARVLVYRAADGQPAAIKARAGLSWRRMAK